MKLQRRLVLVLAVAAGLFLHCNLPAGDKKKQEPEKKKEELAKPIVVDAELINADLKDKVMMQSCCKTYTFKMEKGKSYQIEMSSTVFQPYLRLEDSAGKQIAAAADQFGNRRAIMFHQATKTEDYEIIATTPNGGSMGKFTLVIKDATGFTVLNVADKLNQNDKVYKGAGNKKHKLFLVNLEAGKTYQIDMKSKDFDSYLFFESPDGKLLAHDDDSGGYPDARIIHKATETGKHRIIATYFGGGGNLGDFTLTVRQTDGAPPRRDKEDFEAKK